MILHDERTKILKISSKLIAAGLIHDGQGNLSICEREMNLIAITPSAVPYHQREADDICVVDLEGNLVDGKWKPTTEIQLHLTFYRERKEVNAVIHTHPPKATVFGVIGTQPMPMILNEAAMALGEPVPIAPYARPGTKELAELTQKSTTDGYAAIMAHHGLITVGPDLDFALFASIAVETTAATIILARSMGNEPVSLKDEEVKKLHQFFREAYKPSKI